MRVCSSRTLVAVLPLDEVWHCGRPAPNPTSPPGGQRRPNSWAAATPSVVGDAMGCVGVRRCGEWVAAIVLVVATPSVAATTWAPATPWFPASDLGGTACDHAAMRGYEKHWWEHVACKQGVRVGGASCNYRERVQHVHTEDAKRSGGSGSQRESVTISWATLVGYVRGTPLAAPPPAMLRTKMETLLMGPSRARMGQPMAGGDRSHGSRPSNGLPEDLPLTLAEVKQTCGSDRSSLGWACAAPDIGGRFWGPSVAGPKPDQPDLGPNGGAHSSELGDIPVFPLRFGQWGRCSHAFRRIVVGPRTSVIRPRSEPKET